MKTRLLFVALVALLVTAACGESHTGEMDASVITFDATFPDTGPDAAGVGNAGEPCREDTDCVGGAGTCVTELPGGYCSNLCAVAEDCPAGSACVQIDRSTALCLDLCERGSPDQCRANYGCADLGDGTAACLPGCEDDSDCPDGEECLASAGTAGLCFPPDAELDGPCESDDDCPGEASCRPEDSGGGGGGGPGWPGGVCRVFGCDGVGNTGCPGDSQCIPFRFGGGLCYDGCAEDTDCRDGYECKADEGAPDRPYCQPAFDEDHLGAACSQNRVGCFAEGECWSEAFSSWPDSYCVYVGCDPDGDGSDCPGDGVCAESADGTGICLDGCAAPTDCRAGYDCRPWSYEVTDAPSACMPGCDEDAHCGNEDFECNTGTGQCTAPFVDSTLGEPCLGPQEDGTDDCTGGRCFTEADDGWPAGTCAYPGCRSAEGEGRGVACPSGSVCIDDAAGDPELGICLDACATDATPSPCRPGYACVALVEGETAGACRAACTSDGECGGGRTCDETTGLCE